MNDGKIVKFLKSNSGSVFFFSFFFYIFGETRLSRALVVVRVLCNDETLFTVPHALLTRSHSQNGA